MINKIFALSNDVQYVAAYRDGHLETKSKEGTIGASRKGLGSKLNYTLYNWQIKLLNSDLVIKFQEKDDL